MFEQIEPYPGDPILTLAEVFLGDSRPNKVNLSIGLYYDEDGRVPLLGSVRSAEAARLADQSPRNYLPMEGAANYRQAVQELVFGKAHEAVRSKRIASIQTIGGSGGLKVGSDFLKRYFPNSQVWVSIPTWENHRAIFEGAGFKVNHYPYYDPATHAVGFDAMFAALKELPAQSIVLLHPCCHNPTGADLTREHWQQLIPLLVKRKLIAFMDIAYQGFGDGIEEDAWAIREAAKAGATCLVSNSFSERRLEGIGATRRVHHAFALDDFLVDVDLAVAGIGRARTAFLMARAISIYIWDVASVCQASLEGAGHVDHWRS